MAAIRTQIYLTEEQREKLDALRERDGKTLAEVVREAIDAYIDAPGADPKRALAETFGVLPELTAPSRDEWDRG